MKIDDFLPGMLTDILGVTWSKFFFVLTVTEMPISVCSPNFHQTPTQHISSFHYMHIPTYIKVTGKSEYWG